MPERRMIRVNRKLCTGCLSCMAACSLAHEVYVSPLGSRLWVQLSPLDAKHEIHVCQQCARAACQEVCPNHAITRHPDGYLVIDHELCTGCLECVSACPFKAIVLNPHSGQVIKCDLCQGQPRCVEACPSQTLSLHTIKPKGE